MLEGEILTLCDRNLFMKHCGIKGMFGEDGSVITYIDMDSIHENPYGYLHGGIILTLADVGAGMTSRLYLEHPVTMSSSFNFISNVKGGRVYAKAEVIHAGKTTAVIRSRVVDENDQLLAEGNFSFFNNSHIRYRGEKEGEK